jgi:hypothetical protein
MASPKSELTPGPRHPSPHLGVLALVFTALFCAGLYPVTYFGGRPSFPLPWASPQAVVAFLTLRHGAAVFCAWMHFGSTIPLGIFTASIVSRLEFFGVRAAGPRIALFGGLATAILTMASSLLLWTMAFPGISEDATLVEALHFLNFALGGPGYSVPLGLLMAGVSVPLLFRRLVPRWIPILGLVLAACGELSWLCFEFRPAVALIPLTRFPGFIWLIAVGFALPSRLNPTARAEQGTVRG